VINYDQSIPRDILHPSIVNRAVRDQQSPLVGMDCSRYRMKTVTTVGWDSRSPAWRISCSWAHLLRESSGGTFPNWRYRKKARWRRAIVHRSHFPHPQMINWMGRQCQALLQGPAAAHQVLPGYHLCFEAQLDRCNLMVVPVVVELLLVGTDLSRFHFWPFCLH
jgi:hypothetical protein